MATLTAAGTRHGEARRFVLRGLNCAGFAFVIAAILWVLLGYPYPRALVYSMCISLSCWFLVDVGRIGASRWIHRKAPAGPSPPSRWPGWPWMVPIVVAGSVLGYAIGNEVANTILGRHEPGPFDAGLQPALVALVLAIVPGGVITYVFKSRETIAAQAARVQQAERQAAEQRLKLLESQLEPHMLFNTLANLRALIGVDPVRAQAMLDRLIAFLRASLAGSRASVSSVDEEFARLADYLALMQVRMGARLQTRLDIRPDAAGAQVPALLLQPLVENSIKHGLEPQVAGGRIEVTAVREGASLVLRVRDTGVGPGMAAAFTAGFGLGHVRERLATLYGERAGFEFAPAGDVGGGTLCTVRLPFEAGPPPPAKARS